MSTRSERQAAREEVAAYHEARLSELIQRVGEAVDRFRAGELDAFEADQVIFQHSRSAKELRKFCNPSDVVFTAQLARGPHRSTSGNGVRRTGDDVGAVIQLRGDPNGSSPDPAAGKGASFR